MENLALCRLRVAKIHHLVHKFVYDDKVVADGLLLELLEVLYEHLDEAVEEENDLGGVCVSFRQGEDWVGQPKLSPTCLALCM